MKVSPSLVGTQQVNGTPTGMLGAEELDKLNADLAITAFANPAARQGVEANSPGAPCPPCATAPTQGKVPRPIGTPFQAVALIQSTSHMRD
ncbi:hypothetical protein [Saccharopolyspora erythraea]|uniref:Uncharacterized protein n=1 Tax=Saccharopolyspora erythraea TaxID=1836 RepID=A0ABP3PH86_SACER|nr:hypothetical protein [Saccharopolyspora erythraea]QRK88025.1 hypothetical protein JQX30_25255 [Saccharopolyspora erythraea]